MSCRFSLLAHEPCNSLLGLNIIVLKHNVPYFVLRVIMVIYQLPGWLAASLKIMIPTSAVLFEFRGDSDGTVYCVNHFCFSEVLRKVDLHVELNFLSRC